MNYLLIAFLSLVITMSFILLFKDTPFAKRIMVRQGVSFVGGTAIVVSFTIVSVSCFFIRGGLSRITFGIITASFVMYMFGLIDDWRELSIRAKFSVQILATLLLYYFGVRTQIIYIGKLVNALITFLWIIGISNAFNHLDIMDGVAGGTAIIASCAFFVISYLNSDSVSLILSLVLFGAIAGFMFFNLPPAEVYMGNSGSHFLGFILAAISLNISYATMERKIALLSPVLILSFPVFDTAFLVLMRLRNKRMPLKKSNDHLALRFLKFGYSKKKTLYFMLLLVFIFSFCGVTLSQVPGYVGLIIISFVGLLSVFTTAWMGKVLIDG